jgi:curved DNA-binding protein
MKYKDYYETLGLGRGATQDDIKRAYRKLARKYHPDVSKHTDAEDRFKEIGQAYNVLKDPEKRAAYDRLGSQWREGQEFQPPPNWDEGFEFRGAGAEAAARGNLDEFFEAIFGHANDARAQRGPSHAPAPDRHAKIVIDLEDAYRGAQHAISLQMPVIDAHGHVVMQTRTLNVAIPKGVRAGQHLRLKGQGGSATRSGPTGDLYLEIAFRTHPRFRVDERDVSLDVPVAPWEAALGTRITIQAPDGLVEMTVPKNSAGGQRLRLKGKGIPGSPPGDLYAILKIVLPPADSERAHAAYDAMRQAFDFDPRAHFSSR